MKSKLKVIIPAAIAVIAIILAAVCIKFTPSETADISSLVSTAQKYLIENNYEQAIAEFEKIIDLDPRNADAYIGIAEAYDGMGDTEKAIEWLEKGYELTEDERIFEMLERLKQTEEAEAVTESTTSETVTTTATLKMLTVPDLSGLSEEEAIAACEAAGISYEIITEESENIEKGYVVSQGIPANSEVPEGTKFTFEVSLGVKMVTVPDLTGLTKEEAEKILEENGLTFEFAEVYSDTVDKGNIISQSVEANTQIEAGSKIKLEISKGKNVLSEYFVSELTKSVKEKEAYGYTFDFDENGQLIQITEYWSEYEWKQESSRVFTYSYSDMENNKIKIIRTKYYGEEVTTSEYIYDKSNRALYDLAVPESVKEYPRLKINDDDTIMYYMILGERTDSFTEPSNWRAEEKNIGFGHAASTTGETFSHYAWSDFSDDPTGVFKYSLITTDTENSYLFDMNRIIIEYFFCDDSYGSSAYGWEFISCL